MNWFRWACEGCEARDYHIASLKEELRLRESVINSLQEQINHLTEHQKDTIDHLTGRNRITTVQQNIEPSLHSVPRRNTIQSRITRAEQAESKPELTAQRRKEYDHRIAGLLQPEIEVLDNEVRTTN